MSHRNRSGPGGAWAVAHFALVLAVALGVARTTQVDAASAPRTPARPNVILIVADDQARRQLPREVMPATREFLDAGGTQFTRYFVSTAQCCPSRAAMLTGQYGHNNGVLSNEDGYGALSEKADTLPVWMQDAGYTTAHVGKYLNGYEHVEPHGAVQPGWDEWHTLVRSHYYGYPISDNGVLDRHGFEPRDYVTRVLNRDAAHLVRELGSRHRPFYLQIDHKAPHREALGWLTGRCHRGAVPAPRDLGSLPRVDVPRPPSFNEADMSDKPTFLQSLPRLDSLQVDRIEHRWRCALGSMRAVDRGVRQLHTALRDIGELRNTVIIYTSDNGYFYGEHRIRSGKILPYEETERLPLLMRVPAAYRGGGPRVAEVSAPAANIDLAPTILDLAGYACDGCRTMDGRSLLPLLRGRHPAWTKTRALLFEYATPEAAHRGTCEFSAVRTPDELYAVYDRIADASGQCVDVDERELYDLDADPFELQNLCAGGCPVSPAQQQRELRLARLRDCAGIAVRDPLPPSGHYCE